MLRAMDLVRGQEPDAHLLLAGRAGDDAHAERCRRLIAELALENHVSVLGERSDVGGLLASCDIGVLSSVSEGLPLALLEYGMAGLGVVATAVGECPGVLLGGRAGVLVPPKQPAALAAALLDLLRTPPRRRMLGDALRAHVTATHSVAAVLPQILSVYERVLQERRRIS